MIFSKMCELTTKNELVVITMDIASLTFAIAEAAAHSIAADIFSAHLSYAQSITRLRRSNVQNTNNTQK